MRCDNSSLLSSLLLGICSPIPFVMRLVVLGNDSGGDGNDDDDGCDGFLSVALVAGRPGSMAAFIILVCCKPSCKPSTGPDAKTHRSTLSSWCASTASIPRSTLYFDYTYPSSTATRAATAPLLSHHPVRNNLVTIPACSRPSLPGLIRSDPLEILSRFRPSLVRTDRHSPGLR